MVDPTLDTFDLPHVLLEWEKDCKIDELDLSSTMRDTPKLHAKYIRFLSIAKGILRNNAVRYQKLRKIKFRYYRGEMTQEELKKLGWAQWQGVKPLKNEMDEFLKGDKDLVEWETRIINSETAISTLEQIVRSINSRGYDIRTMLEIKKFYNGVN